MKKVLSRLHLELDPRIDDLIALSVAVQELRAKHPDPERRSATRSLTRSTVLYAISELDPPVRKIFEEGGLHWKSFQDLLGVEMPRFLPVAPDAPLDDALHQALVDFPKRHPKLQSIDLPAIALAVVESVLERPDEGSLPARLGELGVNLDLVRSRLASLVGEPPAETREPAPEAEPKGDGEGAPLVYISYSHKDASWLNRLLEQLRVYEGVERLRVWHDLLLRPGKEWQPQIEDVHDQAKIVIQLISPEYLTSHTIGDWELPRLLERQEQGRLRLMPLLIKAAAWEEVPWLREIQIFPPGARPLARRRKAEVDRLLTEFAREVAVAADEPLPSEPLPRPKLEPRQEDRVPTLLDDPSQVDWLNRRPFAEVMAIRVSELWERDSGGSRDPGGSKERPERSFAVHIHGPWGAGKTSVLNFMRKKLVSGEMGDRWVVIEFNAWRHQRIRPPWWSLIRQVYQQALAALKLQEDPRAVRKLRWRWFVWRMRADWLPAVLAALAIFLIVLFVGEKESPWVKTVDIGLKIVTTLLAAWAGVLAFGRSMLFGSAKAAQSYMDLAQDPMGPIVVLFQKLVEGVGRPLAIFIDDLDRCEGDYVVELLEGVQTLFRRAEATYVVAADKNWIRTSFEKKYSDFTSSISEPGRPLGHLFLEKLFQISATLPQLSPTLRASYWENLLRAASSAPMENIEEVARRAEAKAEGLLHERMAPEEMERVIEDHKSDPVQQQGLRAVAAKLVSTQTAERRRAHFLQTFAGLLEPNPRAMKRLINAYGIHQAVNFLEGRQVDPGALALWTIIEMRWPLLADCLTDSPELVSQIGRKPKPQDDRIPEGVRDLFVSPLVHQVVKGKGVEPSISLDAATIERVVGTAESDSVRS